jgi:hypothetical protein
MVIVRSLTPLGVSAGAPPPHPHKLASPAITNAKPNRLLLARVLVSERHNLKSFRTFGDSMIDLLRRSKAHHRLFARAAKGDEKS